MGRLWPVLPERGSRAQFWPMVAAFGALWGGLEITIGSFLHAVRLPLAGVILAAVAAALLAAQRQILPMRGLSIATGIVAALCKSVSPGGLILGPMLAITAEAALIEIALLPAPRNALCTALAGGAAVFWAMFQGVLSQYFYFGGTVIELYVALLERGAAVVGLTPGEGIRVIAFAVLVVMGLGGGVAIAGRALGGRVRATLDEREAAGEA